MNILCKTKDGGPDSPVDAYWLIEIKPIFSIVLLKFNKGTRENFHSHAFNALTWFLKGRMVEQKYKSEEVQYRRSLRPKYTLKTDVHKVIAEEDSWCLSIRGPWDNTWYEVDPNTGEKIVLTHGRVKL